MALTTTPSELTATALTITTAAQPNITSVGSLTGLTISASGDTPLIITTTNSNGPHMRFQVNGSNKHFIGSGTGIGGMGDADDLALRAYDNIFFGTGDSSTKRLIIASDGHIGVGAAPNTNWRDDLTDDVLMLGTEATLHSDAGVTTELWNNAYVDNSDVFKNISTRGSSRYFQYSGAHKWFTAASASAGSTITSEIQTTPKMILDITGKLNIGGATMSQLLNIQTASTSVAPLVEFRNTAAGAQIGMPANTNALALYTADTERMRIDSAGKVGIGTDSPTTLLHVKGTGDAIRVESTNTGSGGAQMDLLHFTTSPADSDIHALINMGGYTSGTSSSYGSSIRSVWSDVSAKEAQLEFYTRDDSDFAARMTIDKDGNVGIGTTPDVMLHVQKGGEPAAAGLMILEANSGGRQIRFAPPSDSANGYIDYRGGNLLFMDDGSEVARFQGNTSFDVNSGNIRVGQAGGNATAIVQGSSGAGSTNQPGSDLQLKGGSGGGTGGSKVRIFTAPGGSSGTSESAAVERMTILESGLVGINDTTPEHDLHVKTAGSNNNGVFKVGGSDTTLGLEVTYDQSGATSTTIVSNPTYTNANSVMKLAVDGNANADQLVLMGNGKIGIGLDSPSGMLHIRTSTDHNLEFEETGGDLRISALNNARNANIELEFAASQFSFLTGNVGIGLSSGIDGKLHVGGNAVIGDSSTTAFTSFTSGGLDVAVGSGTKALQVWDDNVTGTPRFSVLRDGNVLIGTTDTGATHASNGAYITPDGQFIGRSNGVVGYFNKRATDGKLLDFYRETTDVGAISAWSDNLAVGRINCALLFNDDNNRIIPASVDSNTARDNVIDLGDPSHRFNDVWIGGGIHIGGTGDANKLDDYEEGNWTVAELTGQAGVTTNRAHYTKVGNMVTAWASIEIGTNTDTNTFNATLPFASSVNGYYLGGGGVGYHNLEEDYRENLRPTIENAASNVFFVYDTFSPLSCANFSGHRIDFFVTYMV